MNTVKLVTAATFAITTLASPALADNPNERGEVVVSYAGLDLSTTEGREVLDKRIARAASKVCGRQAGKVFIGFESKIRTCEKETIRLVTPARNLAVANHSDRRLAKRSSQQIRLVLQ